MRYEKADNLMQLALEMQAARGGLTLQDIEQRFDVGRRTAMRMRDAVIRNFPQAEEVDTFERTKRWRIPSGVLNSWIDFTADELADLNAAIELMSRDNRDQEVKSLKALATKIKVLMKGDNLRQVEPDIDALLEAEGLAMRPGPRPRILETVVNDLRIAIKGCSRVKIAYRRRSDGAVNWRTVEPYGFLHGHRNYLVAWHKHREGDKYLTFSLPNIEQVEILNQSFTRDATFSLEGFAEQSFGLFMEEPFDVVWKFSPLAAKDAKDFVFHPSQDLEPQSDGSLIVRFRAGSDLEMAWHLYTWGDQVEVLEPKRLADMVHGQRINWPALP